MARTQKTDSGLYNRPAQIQAPAAYIDDGEGGNSNAGNWVTVRSPMINLASRTHGRGISRAYIYAQLYPEADHWAFCRYASDSPIDATMRMLIDGRVYQIIGVEDVNLEHVDTLIVLTETQSQGSR